MFATHRRSITVSQAKFTGILAYSCTIPGTILCFLVLVAYIITACHRVSRPYLDRVTFRLLTYAIIFNILYGIAFSVTASQVGPGPLCTFGAFAVNLTLTVSSVLTFCIALNLQLVLIHNIKGKVMEKYYLIATTIISLGLTVPAYGLDQFGWQADNSTCWFKNPNHNLRLRWLIGSQSFWMLLIATGETFCSMTVLWKMVRYQFRPGSLGINSSTYNTKSLPRNPTLEHASQYRNIIIRIALYPVVSMLMNYSTSILDIYQTVNGVHTQLTLSTWEDLCLYGLRTAVYGVLAMGDPSFIRAVRALRESRSINRQGSTTLGSSFPSFATTGTASRGAASRLNVNIEVECITQKDVESRERFELESYHPLGDKNVTEHERNSVHVVIPHMMDADTLRREIPRLEQEVSVRDFHRQL